MPAADSVAGILAGANIRLKRQTAGHTEQIVCPACAGGKTREPSLTVTIDQDGGGATWLCHRGGCGWRGGARVHGDAPLHHAAPPPQPKAPPPHTAEQTAHRPDWIYEFFGARKIGARTVNTFGLYVVKRSFPASIGEASAIVFPYVWRGLVPLHRGFDRLPLVCL